MSRQTAFKIQRYKTYLQVQDSGYIYFGDDKDANLYADGTGVTLTGTVALAKTMAVAGATGRPFEVDLTTNVALGSYVNAIKGKVLLSTSGSSSGLFSVFNGEMNMAASAGNPGHYAIYEAEITCPTSWTGTNDVFYFWLESSGTTKANFDTYGNLFNLRGLTTGSGKFLNGNTLRFQLEDIAKYFVFSTAEGTFTTAYPIVTTSTITSTCVSNGLSITAGTLAVDGRLAYFSGTSATPAMSDGYGAVEIDTTISGTATGWFSALSAWVNITGSGVAGTGGYMCAQTNGVYADSGANTGATIIFGMRAQALLTDAATVLCPFSLNTANRVITALFHTASGPAIGYVPTSGALTAVPTGCVPLFCDVDGSDVRYVRVYSATT